MQSGGQALAAHLEPLGAQVDARGLREEGASSMQGYQSQCHEFKEFCCFAQRRGAAGVFSFKGANKKVLQGSAGLFVFLGSICCCPFLDI